jgi:hypothetical protein
MGWRMNNNEKRIQNHDVEQPIPDFLGGGTRVLFYYDKGPPK